MADNLNVSIDKMKFDTRMIDYNIKQGVTTLDAYKQHLFQLPDLTGETVPLSLDQSSSSLDEEDSLSSESVEFPEVADPFNPSL